MGLKKCGKYKQDKKEYVDVIVAVLTNVCPILKDDGKVFIVANDKFKFYPKIARMIGSKISVWSISTLRSIEKKFGKHPTQKPFDLLKSIVLASINKDD